MTKLEALRRSGKITALVLSHLKTMVLKGETSGDNLDRTAEFMILSYGGIPAFKGYRNFPATICLSINNEVVHGIPYGKRLKRGDVISIDVGVKYNDYYTDSALTVMRGFNIKKRKLIKTTKLTLDFIINFLGLSHSQERILLGDVPRAIQKIVKNKYGIIEDFGGHGIGKKLHQDFFVPNTYKNLEERVLSIGQTLCIEPMLALGTNQIIKEDDGTVITRDGKPAAHFEHTLYINNSGIEILTKRTEERIYAF